MNRTVRKKPEGKREEEIRTGRINDLGNVPATLAGVRPSPDHLGEPGPQDPRVGRRLLHGDAAALDAVGVGQPVDDVARGERVGRRSAAVSRDGRDARAGGRSLGHDRGEASLLRLDDAAGLVLRGSGGGSLAAWLRRSFRKAGRVAAFLERALAGGVAHGTFTTVADFTEANGNLDVPTMRVSPSVKPF